VAVLTVISYSASDWAWSTKCHVDEEIYSFEIREYDAGSSPSPLETVASLMIFDGESPETKVRRQEWEKQNAVVLHYEDQLKQLKLKQQSLFRSLSRGFEGDLKHTVAYVTAITRAYEDIETVEGHIRDLSNHAKAKRCEYLVSRDEDDQRVLTDARKALKEAQDRLETIDAMDITGIQSGQAMIRLSKERIRLVQKDIELRAHEMNELAGAAQRLPDDGSEYIPESAKTVERGGKGKKKVSRDRSHALQVGSVDVQIRPQFPGVQAAIGPEVHCQATEGSSESSSDSGGEQLTIH
jgi:hypothetical protein